MRASCYGVVWSVPDLGQIALPERHAGLVTDYWRRCTASVEGRWQVLVYAGVHRGHLPLLAHTLLSVVYRRRFF